MRIDIDWDQVGGLIFLMPLILLSIFNINTLVQ